MIRPASGTVIAAASLAAFSVLWTGCGDTTGPSDEPDPGDIQGRVLATDGRGGVDGARVDLEGDTLTRSDRTGSDGEFRFGNLPPGSYRVTLLLPRGYRTTGPVDRQVEVDGDETVEFQGEPVTVDTARVSPGESDTLATGSGAFVSVDATGAGSEIEVALEEAEQGDMDDGDLATTPVRFRIRPSGSDGARGSPAVRMARAAARQSASTVEVELWQKASTDPEETSFVFDVEDDDGSLRLFADATGTTWRDPETGESERVPLHSFETSGSADISALVGTARARDDCSDELRELEPWPDDGDGGRALILIHGLQLHLDDCGDFESDGFNPESEWDPLVTKLRSNSEIDSSYRFFTYTYPTNAPVLAASSALWDEMQNRNIEQPVLLAHSMGGLVGRGLIADRGPDAVTALLALGTPHRGSPLADVLIASPELANIASATCPSPAPTLLCVAVTLGAEILPDTEGLRDLQESSDLVQRLREIQADSRKVFTLGGRITSEDQIGDHGLKTVKVYEVGRHVMRFRGQESDGMVPVSSATPDWSALQIVLDGHDHSEMRRGELSNASVEGSVQENVQPALSVLAECPPPPERLEGNDFEVSGSVARVDRRTVRVTLNPITIDGEVVTDLSEDNLRVVENGCERPLADFSTENVGIDLVFVQDLSGSMGEEIDGVRTSVRAFASDLAERGVNPRMGSVGYSGQQSTIPSTPGPSPCEFLGPVQTFTDASTLRSHVAEEWFAAVGAGCDPPENGLEAIEHAHRELEGRNGAARVYLNITDVSHHTAETSCNGLGPCTDQSLSSIVDLVGNTSAIFAVGSSDPSTRTAEGGLDPFELARQTGGRSLTLPSDGVVDLTSLGISEVLGEAVTFTFESASPQEAVHELRIRVEIGDRKAELAPDLVQYDRIAPGLQQ